MSGPATRGTVLWDVTIAEHSDGAAGSYRVMVAVEAMDFQVVLYQSHDLKDWELLSSFGPANATGGV